MIKHVLKFIGLLVVIALLSHFGPMGCLAITAIILTGLWKLME